MATTATTPSELIIAIEQVIGSKTQPNSITPDTHSGLLDNMVQVLSASTNGIFDIDNSGNTVPSSFEYDITDSIQQNGPQSYLRHDGRTFRFVGEVTNDRTYVISQSNAITPFAGPVFMLNNSSLVGVSQRIDFFLENNSSGTGSTTNMNFRRQNIGGNSSSWIDFITQDGNTQNLEFNSAKSGSANYGDVIVQNGNFVIKNLGTGTSVTNLGIDANGTLVSGSTGGSSALIYRALLQQVGTDDPTVTVLENTLGVVPTFARTQQGLYEVEHNLNIFVAPTEKLWVTIGNNSDGQNAVIVVDTGSYTPFGFEFFTREIATGNLLDEVLRATPIEIRYYP